MGKLAIPKVHEKYETGQFFLHRVFGYRGVILFPWRAKIYDRNTYVPYQDTNTENASTTNVNETNAGPSTTAAADETTTTKTASGAGGGGGVNKTKQSTRKIESTESDSTRNDLKKEVMVDVQTYYQVLIDSRDCPHVVIFQCPFFLN